MSAFSFRFTPIHTGAVCGIALALAAAGPTSILVHAAESTTGTTVQAGSAMPVVDAFYQTLLATMKDGPALGFDGRVSRLTPAITQAFDLPAMTKIAAGAVWPTLSPDDQSRLINAFSRFSIASYAANFDSYDDERFEVEQETPAPGNNGRIIVKTQLIPKKGDPVEMGYLLRRNNGKMQIIDIFINGTISEMAARRSEFSSILNRGGAQALNELLEAKIKALAATK